MTQRSSAHRDPTDDPVGGRRSALRALGAVGAASLASCRGTGPASAPTSTRCVITATETAGPFPLLSVLGNPALVRKDITEGKAGIPLTLALKIVDHDQACAALNGAAIYIWHCDANGEYSGYSARENGTHARETFLRGVQLTDADGQVTFTTIFPGWYMPRLTHIHVQVFVAGSVLSAGAVAAATTQVCFPDAVTAAAYDNAVLYPKGPNRVTPTYASDQVFGNGIGTELLTVSGSATTGYHAGIVIGMSSTGNSPESGDAGGGPRGPGPGGMGGPPPGGPPPFPAPPGIGRAAPERN